MRAVTICSVLLCLLWPVARNARCQGDFTLTYTPFKSLWNPHAVNLSRTVLEDKKASAEIPGKLRGKKVAFYTASVAGRDLLLAMADDEDAKLYVDVDGDGDPFNDKPYRPKGRRSDRFGPARSYGPISVPVGESKGSLSASFHVDTVGYSISRKRAPDLRLVLAGRPMGTVQLGRQTYRIALFDCNFDGRYDEVCDSFDGDYRSMDADCFAIDLNGDGRFYTSKEFQPLSKRIFVAGKCYTLAVLPDGSKVRLRQVQSGLKLGALETQGKGVELLLFTPEVGLVTLHGPRTQWALPAGAYTLMQWHLTLNDETETRWDLYPPVVPERRQTFQIAEGETYELKIGLPLRVETRVSVGSASNGARRRVSVRYRLRGQGGEEYAGRAYRNGRPYRPAQIRFLDETGRVLETGTLKHEESRIEREGERTMYLEGGATTDYSWKVPAEFHGKFCVKIKLFLGPFEWKAEDTWHTID